MPELARRGHIEAPEALPVDGATLYPEDDGFFGRRAKARRAKLLANVDGVLRCALAPGETIRYAARATRYFFAEHVFGGAAAQYHNMTALVVTDRRLLLVQIGSRGKPGDIKNQVALAAIRGARAKLLGVGWTIEVASGRPLRFVSVRRADRRRLEALLSPAGHAPPARAAPAGAPLSLEHLCPACLRHVPGPVGTTLTCPAPDCRIPFRDPRRAARLSAFMPGLGDLYLRHHLFGAMEFLGSAIMVGLGLAFAVDAFFDPQPAKVGTAALLLLGLVAVPRVIDHRITLHMGRKGLVPLALAPAPGAQPRNLPSFPRWSPLLFLAGAAVAGAIVVGMGQDLRHDAGGREAERLAAQGRFDDALARWTALERAGGASEERRVRFALALLEAGDLEGMDAVRASFEGTPIDAAVVRRWNTALDQEQAVLADYGAGVEALVSGEPDAWEKIDRALAYLARVKRPHLPATRGEVSAHLAMGVLAEPLSDEDVASAPRWLDAVEGAPAAEVAALKAAYASVRGEIEVARAALAGLDAASLPGDFRLLVLEARARTAEGERQRAEVRADADAFPREGLTDAKIRRLEEIRAVAAGR